MKYFASNLYVFYNVSFKCAGNAAAVSPGNGTDYSNGRAARVRIHEFMKPAQCIAHAACLTGRVDSMKLVVFLLQHGFR